MKLGEAGQNPGLAACWPGDLGQVASAAVSLPLGFLNPSGRSSGVRCPAPIKVSRACKETVIYLDMKFKHVSQQGPRRSKVNDAMVKADGIITLVAVGLGAVVCRYCAKCLLCHGTARQDSKIAVFLCQG